jgi:hypothetical protein
VSTIHRRHRAVSAAVGSTWNRGASPYASNTS